ncbi:hypothetical protein M0804_009129 [Polistes exclamans]|nr:hypothetical protein M0804_009129 [Polistes exclamans]
MLYYWSIVKEDWVILFSIVPCYVFALKLPPTKNIVEESQKIGGGDFLEGFLKVGGFFAVCESEIKGTSAEVGSKGNGCRSLSLSDELSISGSCSEAERLLTLVGLDKGSGFSVFFDETV